MFEFKITHDAGKLARQLLVMNTKSPQDRTSSRSRRNFWSSSRSCGRRPRPAISSSTRGSRCGNFAGPLHGTRSAASLEITTFKSHHLYFPGKSSRPPDVREWGRPGHLSPWNPKPKSYPAGYPTRKGPQPSGDGGDKLTPQNIIQKIDARTKRGLHALVKQPLFGIFSCVGISYIALI